MKVKSMRPLALLMAVVMLLGLFPSAAFAVESEDDSAMAANSIVTTSVEYGSTKRETATITYHKEIQEAPAANIVFLLDVSRQGRESFPQFRKMISDAGDDLFDWTNVTMQVITYTQTAELCEQENDPMVINGRNLRGILSGIAFGEGTADAAKALEKTAEVVGDIKNDNPTVVFWVLGDSFGSSDEDEVENALKALKNKLGVNDALLTWQIADTSTDLLTKYATQYIPAGETADVPAAYAERDADDFYNGMLDSLENILHDHYRQEAFTLSLEDDQSLVKEITAARWESKNTVPQVTVKVAENGQSVTVDFGKLCGQVEGDLILEAELDTGVNIKELVIAESETEELCTGLFDEKKGNSALSFPAVELDRRQYTVTFRTDGYGEAPLPVTAMADEMVTIPSGEGLTNSGSSFGGWNTADGDHYTAGQIITMPAKNMCLTPAWGHVEVELELGTVYPALSSGNQMSEKANVHKLLNFEDAQLGSGTTVGKDSIHSLQVIDESLTYNSTPVDGDSSKVVITNSDVDAVYARHVGATSQDRVVAYLVKCTHDNVSSDDYKFDLIIAGPGGVMAPADMSEWMQYSTIEDMDLSALDTSQVTNMKAMFQWCQELTKLRIREGFDTSKVTDMTLMFSLCGKLSDYSFLTLFNTKNVTSMSQMFYGNHSARRLDLSRFDTRNVTSMHRMFFDCSNLESLIFGNSFNTSSVTNMAEMFASCRNLRALNVTGFDTSKVTTMYAMFSTCSALTTLDVSNFDTSKVTTMQSMFSTCSALTTLDVSNFDTSKVTKMQSMFSTCSALTTLDVSNFDTSKVTDMSQMFAYCSALTELNVSSFDTSKVTNMSLMFRGCKVLEELDLSSFDTSAVTDMHWMFMTCSKLSVLDLGQDFNVSKVTTFANMFDNCGELDNIEGTLKFDSSNQAADMSFMFYLCGALKEIPFSFLEQETPISFDSLTTAEKMFYACHQLTRADLSNWQLGDLTNTAEMFAYCDALTEIDLSWTGIKAIDRDFTVENMFINVPAVTLEIGQAPAGDDSFMHAVVQEFLEGGEGRSITVKGSTWTPGGTNGLPAAEMTEPEFNEEPASNSPAQESPQKPVGNTEEPVASPDTIPQEPSEGTDTASEEPAPPDTEQEPEDTADSGKPSGELEPSDGNPVVSPGTSDTTVPEEPTAQVGTEDTASDVGGAGSPAALAALAIVRSVGRSTPALLADGAEKNYTVSGNIWTHNEATPAGSQFQYLIRVKYVGDNGAQSGTIQINFPIPENVRVLTEKELTELGETSLVAISSVEYSEGVTTSYLGGRVVEAPAYDPKTKTMTATLDGLFAGNEYEISIWCTNEKKPFDSETGYAYWDGTASAQDEAASVPSNIYRLWDVKGAVVKPPEATDYTLSYKFAGSVPPDATLPTTSVHKAGGVVTAAEKPETEYSYFSFKGWTYTDADGKQQRVEPGAPFIMPAADTILVGTWTLDKTKAPKLTVKYQYDDSAPADAPKLPVDAEVTIGNRYNVIGDLPDAGYASFNGWEPSLSVEGQTITLVKDEDGLYSGDGYIIPTTGVLTTTQFLYKEDVVLTFTGSWTAYTGTIQFDANGGLGTMKEMTNVTHDTSEPLTANAFTRDGYTFTGWAASENGQVIKTDKENASGLIEENGETVTLYAQWRANPITSRVIIVTPADIIIYMGGKDGYEHVIVDEDTGAIKASSSLPEPGFLFTLPEMLKEALETKGETITAVKFHEFASGKEWTVEPYAKGNSTVYRLVPGDGQAHVRVQFTNAQGQTVTEDQFDVGRNVNQELTMTLYKGDVGVINAIYDDVKYPIQLGESTLTVRGVTDEAQYATVTDDATAPVEGKPAVTAESGTSYTINGSDVPVEDASGVALLFDSIIDASGEDRTGLLENKAEDTMETLNKEPASGNRFAYAFQYLDLVDTKNGNAWVKASDDLTIYWPLPEGADTNTLKVLHFKNLHRDMTTGQIEDEIAECDVEIITPTVSGNHVTFKIGPGGFSPFALVWEEDTPASSFTIEATVSGSGSISPSGTISVAAGSNQTITFTPDSGYYVSSVVVDGQSVSWTGNSYTFTNVTANHTIIVTFAKSSGGSSTTYYTIDAEAGQGGEISPDGRVRVARGSDKTFTITPDKGYRIADVLVDGRSIGIVSRYTFENVRSDHTIEVIFEKYSSVADPDDTGVSEWLDTSDHRDFLHGYTDGTFGPNRNMTRGEVAQMFYNLLLEQDVPQTTAFTDVPADMWCADAVNTLASLGIVEGIGNGLYAPDRAITRAEFTVIAMRFAELDTSGENIFSDVDTGDWFYEQVVGSIKYGWIQGYADGTFRPDNTITRAEVTTITNRMLGRAADEAFVDRHSDELRQFPDVPESYWAYYNIMEATNAHDFGMENGAENWTGLN